MKTGDNLLFCHTNTMFKISELIELNQRKTVELMY